jgi:hypothetical protein
MSVYLINVSIVNFNIFKKFLGIGPSKFLNEIRSIVKQAIDDFHKANKEAARILFTDERNADISIVFPQATESEATKLCVVIREKVYQYLKNRKVDKVFVNLAVLSYSPQGKPNTDHEFLANLNIKKLFIGSEVRRQKRINYKTDIEVMVGVNKKEEAQTLDISSGGLCFVSKNPLETDSKVALKLKLSPGNKPLQLCGRIAWIKNIGPGQYKIGLEFIGLRGRTKALIGEFIKSISA